MKEQSLRAFSGAMKPKEKKTRNLIQELIQTRKHSLSLPLITATKFYSGAILQIRKRTLEEDLGQLGYNSDSAADVQMENFTGTCEDGLSTFDLEKTGRIPYWILPASYACNEDVACFIHVHFTDSRIYDQG
jgi:hypothetical protein